MIGMGFLISSNKLSVREVVVVNELMVVVYSLCQVFIILDDNSVCVCVFICLCGDCEYLKRSIDIG